MSKIKIRTKKPWIGYPGTPIQQNYAEELEHGYLLWDIKNSSSWDVNFRRLTNVKPFVTLSWNGDLEDLLKSASDHPDGSRFRIRSFEQLGQKDIKKISETLKGKKLASEVTFKSDFIVDKSRVQTENSTLEKTDLRNPEVLLKLTKDYHKNSSYSLEIWEQVYEQIKKCLASVVSEEDVRRNSKWSLRYLGFDNMFSYGDGNVINFDKLNGIVGIFGPNRAGKSSIIGTLMYALFNTTDRGPMKNIHLCNIRKPYCSARVVLNHDGTDYVIERQTTKSENKKGVVSASTALNVFRIKDDGEAEDLAGEQRADTEKVVKMLVGNQDDFLMTTLSAQGETNQFISQGSTRRRAVLSKFFDLDIFDKMFELSNRELHQLKAQLKNFPDKDWTSLFEKLEIERSISQISLETSVCKIEEKRQDLAQLQLELSKHKDTIPVTSSQVSQQRDKLSRIKNEVRSQEDKLASCLEEILQIEKKISTIETVKKENDISDLKDRLVAQQKLESLFVSLKHEYEKERDSLERKKKSLKILEEVPCGDDYPTCKFIKDAHFDKANVKDQKNIVADAMEKMENCSSSLELARSENVKERLEKIEKIIGLESKLHIELSKKSSEKVLLENRTKDLQTELTKSEERLKSLEDALKNQENVEVVTLRSEIEDILGDIRILENEKLDIATRLGRYSATREKLEEEKLSRDSVLEKMKVFEVICSAFSKKGLPLIITKSQLPIINSEISKVLQGIVDFTIELENDEDSDSVEIYINYGDSRRVIELCSGMEKTIASLAVRVSMVNMSSLPRPDMFIVDEGFGTLDDASVEACNRFLLSLKKFFRVIAVITHVDGIKDAVDHVLEITKVEKDTKVVYE